MIRRARPVASRAAACHRLNEIERDGELPEIAANFVTVCGGLFVIYRLVRRWGSSFCPRITQLPPSAE
ncbi:hypothetical protein [Sphingomonas sp. SRS2]|uniref:hypothetical protein n=1 Tax=Sphingomonas sp. SRS2 TaxID=133190 RepID=UPI00128DD445|nr:hypothetical protein [Sphingomonas sp. SRS2]